ncbi:Rieske [Pseudohyphozyma bogoriensis]|nr:Rieske [Pseudohyphozyma bogoriensis]
MESECPHLGASMEQAKVEDLEDGIDEKVLVCPWHLMDFNVRTGESSTAGMRSCTFDVQVHNGMVYIEPPGDAGDDWRLLSTRAVSERFPDVEPPIPSPSYDISTPPTTLVSFCRLILLTPDPTQKVTLTRTLVQLFRSGQLTKISSPNDVPLPLVPPREKEIQIVGGQEVGKRGKGGTVASRAKMLHALAWIELWAIDLAIDICGRFANWKVGSLDGKKGKKLPLTFFADFLKVAEDEAKHFSILRERMNQMGYKFGEFAVHNGLWDSASETMHSLFSRIAIIHLVHEARGLDVNPLQIKRCRAAGDNESADVMTIIHNDEVTHVACGHRHFQYLCNHMDPPLDPVETFRNEVKINFHGKLKGPFNDGDREKAGLTDAWYGCDLEGKRHEYSGRTGTTEVKGGVDGVALDVQGLKI